VWANVYYLWKNREAIGCGGRERLSSKMGKKSGLATELHAHL